MLVVHDAEDVPERVDDRRGDESGSALGRLLVHRRAHGNQPAEGPRYIVDVPVDDRAGGPVRPAVPGEPAVDDAQLVLVVADAELDVHGRPPDRANEVRLDAEQFGVPAPGSHDVVGEETDGGQSAQHRRFLSPGGSDTHHPPR
jgi:hypothetical protein